MDDKDVARHWNSNAAGWIALSSAGYDIYRDKLNTPAFVAMLPALKGLTGVDLGCGEGHNTRLLASLGANVTGVDIADALISHAQHVEHQSPQGIHYQIASASNLPFAAHAFDFVTATMSLMDMADPVSALAESYRVLKPAGFLQFSISHPCFDTPHRRNLRNDQNLTYAIEVGDYFTRGAGRVDEWTFGAAPPEVKMRHPAFRVPRFTYTLSEWLNFLTNIGFCIERLEEPKPRADAMAAEPRLQDASIVAYFLHARARKPL